MESAPGRDRAGVGDLAAEDLRFDMFRLHERRHRRVGEEQLR